MAQLVKCLKYMHEEQSSLKKPAVVAYICSLGNAETGACLSAVQPNGELQVLSENIRHRPSLHVCTRVHVQPLHPPREECNHHVSYCHGL